MDEHSLYIHIPFCLRKCFFCSFAVVVNQAQRIPDYLGALAREAERHKGARFSTVYIGGGTPSVLGEEMIAELWAIMRRNFDLASVVEVTFECNPENVTPAQVALLRKLGVTRVSLGVQSLQDRFLAYLGRSHQREDAARAFGILRREGFDNINVDLMYGFTGQRREELLADIRALVDFGGEHLSIYSLSIEERSLFFARKEASPEAASPDFYELICAEMEAAGLRQYEISNFARPGKESRHNIHYWEGGEYVGLGMAAHSHLDEQRSWNADTLPQYLKLIDDQRDAHVGSEKLPPREKMIEALLFGLRMNQGVDLGRLQQRFSLELPEERREAIESFIEMGLLEEDGMILRATARGRLVLDEISARLV